LRKTLSMPPRNIVLSARTLPVPHIARQRGVWDVVLRAMTSQSSRVT